MSTANNWRPACSLQLLHVRAAMLRAVREFFYRRDYLEVETPCLSGDIVIDAWLEPMQVMHAGQRWFLQTSPEACMKRLLASGSGSIFQISRVFRSGECGERHNPEFTMIEWYGVNSTWEQQLELTESLVRFCLNAAATESGFCATEEWRTTPFTRTTYADAFRRAFQLDVHHASGADLMSAAREYGIQIPDSCDPSRRDEILNVMLASAIEPDLGRYADGSVSPEFLCDYPPSQAALAVVSDASPAVARRFELYIDGIELCNGYQELTDGEELRRRELLQNAVRSDSDQTPLPGASKLLSALESGLPECSGVALGFDRLVMIATAAKTISEVLPFPADRA